MPCNVLGNVVKSLSNFIFFIDQFICYISDGRFEILRVAVWIYHTLL